MNAQLVRQASPVPIRPNGQLCVRRVITRRQVPAPATPVQQARSVRTVPWLQWRHAQQANIPFSAMRLAAFVRPATTVRTKRWSHSAAPLARIQCPARLTRDARSVQPATSAPTKTADRSPASRASIRMKRARRSARPASQGSNAPTMNPQYALQCLVVAVEAARGRL